MILSCCLFVRISLALIVAVVIAIAVARVASWSSFLSRSVLDLISSIGELTLDVSHLCVNVVKGFVIGQSDVLEELNVKEDGELVQLLHQNRYLVIHSLRCHLEVMLGLFKFSHIPDELLVLFILSAIESHCSAGHVLVLGL